MKSKDLVVDHQADDPVSGYEVVRLRRRVPGVHERRIFQGGNPVPADPAVGNELLRKLARDVTQPLPREVSRWTRAGVSAPGHPPRQHQSGRSEPEDGEGARLPAPRSCRRPRPCSHLHPPG